MLEALTSTTMTETPSPAARLPGRGARITIPASIAAAVSPRVTSRLQSQLGLAAASSPVNQNGSFEFDRIIKSGYVQKRTQKTKVG